jgi:hypothetical protein
VWRAFGSWQLILSEATIPVAEIALNRKARLARKTPARALTIFNAVDVAAHRLNAQLGAPTRSVA